MGSPYRDAQVHAAAYALIPAATEAALRRLAERFPEVDDRFAARFLQLAALTAGQVPVMVYSHEMGHYREASKAGGQPEIEMTGWMSGLTRLNLRGPAAPSDAQLSDFAAAGVNQEQLNAGYMYRRWARNGSASYGEALAYLVAQTNLALYSANTLRRQSAGTVAASDDIARYQSLLERNGQKLRTGQLLAMAAAADLASAPVWASVIGQVRYLAEGQREVPMPSVELGNLEVTLPNLHVLLTPDGPVVGGNVLVGPGSKTPAELSFEVRADGSAMAAGARLYDVALGDRVSVNPFIRLSTDRGQLGYLVGAEARVRLTDEVSVVGSAAFRHRDLIAPAEGQGDGVAMHVGVAFPF